MSNSPEVTASPPAGSKWQMWTGTQIRILLLLMLVNMSNYLDRGVIAILQEPIKQDLHLQDWQLGMISGPAFAVLYSVAGIPIARVADRSNRITVLAIALAIWSGLTAICGAAGSFLHLVLARLGVGAAEGACTPTSHSLIADAFPPRQRGMALSVLTTSIPVAQLFAPLLGGVVAMTYGWRVAFVVVGLPGLLLAALLWLTVKEPRAPGTGGPARESTFWGDIRILFAKRSFVWLFIASVFMGMSITSTNAFTASYFLRQYDLSIAEVGALMAAGLGVAGLTGTFLGGWIADRFAGRYGRSYAWTCTLGATLASVFFLIVYNLDNWLVAIPFLLLANISTDLKNGPNTAVAQNIAPPGMRSITSAVMMMGAIGVGTTIGPLMIGAVSDLSATRLFPEALGSFAAACPGGKAGAGAGAALAAACEAASAGGLRIALMIPCVTYLLSAASFFVCGRVIDEPLET
jgi:predicted MFS family arabinose efflux permease